MEKLPLLIPWVLSSIFHLRIFEKYYELGKKIALESFRFNLKANRPVKSQRTQVENQVTKKMRENLADLDQKMSLKKKAPHGKRWVSEMKVKWR